MLDAAFIRENLEAVKANCANRNVPTFPVDRAIAFDNERKRLVQLRSETAAQQNKLSEGFKSATPEQRAALKEQSAKLKADLGAIDAEL
ncbi:MAG TPA: serine--tRNA ligase, partial [Urbifossiella sp.]|nr:serine--tRNA ligase [Urbifossiella sp.]